VVFTQPWTNTYAILSMKPAPNNYWFDAPLNNQLYAIDSLYLNWEYE
jgi:hypothetical protein